MSDGRLTYSLWYWLGFDKIYDSGIVGVNDYKLKWRFPTFIKRRMYKHVYFWDDTFRKYIYRYFICKVMGHRGVEIIDINDKYRVFCYNCCVLSKYVVTPCCKIKRKKWYDKTYK